MDRREFEQIKVRVRSARSRLHAYGHAELRQLLADARRLVDFVAEFACPGDREQDTFSGFGEREPMLVSELLADLGVSDAAFGAQRDAVQRWLDDGNTPSRMLAAALRARGLR